MKKKFSSILGVGLALALALAMASSALPANMSGGPEPAEAGTLAWSTLAIPSTANNQLVVAAADLGPVAPSPNFGTDQTVFAAVNEANLQTVYKSVDGGHTWVASSSRPLESGGAPIVALVVSNQYATDSTVVVATADYVYRSTDGGASFSQLGGKIGDGTHINITCLAISPNYDGVGVLAVGLADARYDTSPAPGTEVQVWGWDGALTWKDDFGMPATKRVDVTAVAFSPNYAIDTTLLAVGSANVTGYTADTYPGTRLYTKVGDNAWDADIGGGTPTLVASAVYDVGDQAVSIIYSSIALPSNYDGTKATLRRAYVSIVSHLGVGTNQDDVYRVTNITAGVDMGLDQQLCNIDYSGTYTSGTVVGGLYRVTTGATDGAADTYYTTNPTSATVDWFAATNPPSGYTDSANKTTCWVAMDKAYATSSIVFAGTYDKDSAFAVSYDGAVNWTETGLIDTELNGLLDIALSPDYANDETMYLLTARTAGTNVDSLWRTTNAGTYWDRVDWRTLSGNTGIVRLSQQYATDQTVYIGDVGDTDIRHSSNAGEEWSDRTIASGRGVEIQSMAAPDATTLYVGDDDDGIVAKSTNSGWVWPAGNAVATGGSGGIKSIAVEDSVVLVGDEAGSVFRSTDAGAAWSQVGALDLGDSIYVDFDGDTIYAAGGDVYRLVIGDADWTDLDSGLSAAAVGLTLADDGTLYVLDPSGTASEQTLRSINPTEAEPTPGVAWEYMTGSSATASAISVAGASGNEVAIIQNAAVQVFTDTISLGTAGPTLVSPADGTVVTTGTSFTAKFEAITNALTYDVYVSRDPDFSYADDTDIVTAPSTQKAMTLQEAATNYWMVRVATPLLGAWSEVWSVEAQVISPVVAPTPQSPGAWSGTTTDVAVEPVLNWSAFKYATGYEVQLASDTEFSADSLIADLALGNVTSWKCTTTLDNDTTYYWKVRAITATATSDWSNVVGFTTEAVPTVWTCSFCGDTFATEAELAAHIAAEHPTVPTTPSYVWAIIGIGAVLVIAVIVLITRTRRVV